MNCSEKKVMFITGSLTDGGAERVMSILASKCADMGAEVSLVVLRKKKCAYQISKNVRVFQIENGSGKLQTVNRIKQLRKIIRTSNADVLIPFLPIVTLYTMIANIGLGKKMITSERADPNVSIFASGLSMKDRVGNLLMRKLGLFKLADWMVFQTPDAQKWYPKSIQKKSCIIFNPLDTDSLPAPYQGEREKVIVAAGRFVEAKNFPMLLKGFAEFHKDFPEYSLTLFGEGNLREEYEQLIRKLDIEQFVNMPGFTSGLTQKINQASMYISTSNHEGISNSMLEALGMGIPTIVTDCPVGGAKMFVQTDENGILIPMNDVALLVQAMKKIASDQEYAKKISRGATKIREQLSAINICRQWLELM